MDPHQPPSSESRLKVSDTPAASSAAGEAAPRLVLRYRAYRMKENVRQQFRWAPHVSGATVAKRKDYAEDVYVSAANEYEVWTRMRETGNPLQVGDILETETGDLKICKYVGFEQASWWIPEAKPEPEVAAASSAAQTPGLNSPIQQ